MHRCALCMVSLFTHTRNRSVFLRATFRTRSTDRSTMDALNHRVPFFVRGFRPLHTHGTGCPSRSDGVVSTPENASPETTTRAATGTRETTRRVRKRARGERAFFFFVFVVVVERASIRDATRANAPR